MREVSCIPGSLLAVSKYPMNLLTHDSRQAWQQVIARPFLSLAIIITLALGIGASSAVFSLVYGILLRPYPYRDPDCLVRLQTVIGETAGNVRGASIPDLEDLRAGTSTVEALGAYLAFPNTLTVDGRAHVANLTFLVPERSLCSASARSSDEASLPKKISSTVT